MLAAEFNQPHCMIVSNSSDGELVSISCQLLDHHPCRGSSNRGGIRALKGMIRKIKNGIPGCITVDGPRGPRHLPKKGIFELSLITKTPIIPLLAIPNNYWTLSKTWDLFRIPKHFSTIFVWHGEPIFVDDSHKSDAFGQLIVILKSQLEEAEQNIKLEYFHS